jgi:hypothetical protein
VAFNARLALRATRWYYTLPERRLLLRQPRRPKLLSLVMIWSDSFQHFVMDTLAKARVHGGGGVVGGQSRVAPAGSLPLAWRAWCVAYPRARGLSQRATPVATMLCTACMRWAVWV